MARVNGKTELSVIGCKFGNPSADTAAQLQNNREIRRRNWQKQHGVMETDRTSLTNVENDGMGWDMMDTTVGLYVLVEFVRHCCERWFRTIRQALSRGHILPSIPRKCGEKDLFFIHNSLKSKSRETQGDRSCVHRGSVWLAEMSGWEFGSL